MSLESISLPLIGREEENQIKVGLRQLIRYVTAGQRSNIYAIILTGSIPSGEGRLPQSDLDILVITNVYDPLLERRAEAALRSLQLPCKFEISQTPRFIFYRMPSATNYDLRKTGLVVYGDKNAIESFGDFRIPKYEGLKYFFNNSVVNLNKAVDKDVIFGNKLSNEKTDELVSGCCKAYLAACAALLILKDEYQIGYEARRKHFSKLYETHYEDLHNDVPDLSRKIDYATKFKLKIDTPKTYDPLEFSMTTYKDMTCIMRYVLRHYFASDEEDEVRLILLLKKFPHNWINSFYYSVKYISELSRPPPLKSFFVEPIVNIYVSSACIMLAAKHRRLDPFLIIAEQKVREIFSPLTTTEDGWENWDITRRVCSFLHPDKLITPQFRYRSDPIIGN